VLTLLLLSLAFTATTMMLGTTAAHAIPPASAVGSNGVTHPAQNVGVNAPAAGGGSELNVVANVQGLQSGYNGQLYDGFSPPDVQVATGPTEVVEMVNVHEEVFSKTGATLSYNTLASVFNAGTDDIADPRVLYDNTSQRFFASVFDWTTQKVDVAASRAPNVDSGWYDFSYCHVVGGNCAQDICPDQPYIGVSADKIVVTANAYYVGTGSNPCRPTGNYAFQEYWVQDKSLLTSGTSGIFYSYTNSYWFGLRPVTSYGSTAYFVCSDCVSGSMLLLQVSGIPSQGVSPTINNLYLPFVAPNYPVPAPHYGNSDVIDTNSDFEIQDTAWSGNGFWVTMNDGCVPAGDNALRSCVKLVGVSVSPPTITANSDIYGPPGEYLFYPAVAADSFGNIVIVGGYSSTSINPGVFITGLKSGESFNALESNLVTLTQGTGWYCGFYRSANLCRYGDYFGASPDPADRTLIWIAGQYETSSGWSTSVASVRVGLAAVTLSYSTQDGTSAPQSPVITYTESGTAMTAMLTRSPQTFYMDFGSTWSVGTSLGGTSSERWASSGNQGGTVTQDAAAVVQYYHQYLVKPQYSVTGGGSGYGAPSVTCPSFGSPASSSSGSPIWTDAGGTCSYASTLPGSSGTERWSPASTTVASGTAGTVSDVYYHQYLLTVGYSVKDGGAPTAPMVTAVQFGSSGLTTLSLTPSGYWLDGGSAWKADTAIAGATGERWVDNGTTSGTVSAAATETFTYQHQYYVNIASSSLEGGSVSSVNGWLDAGTTVTLSAQASSGWQFEGWNGSGTGFYSGTSPGQSFTLGGSGTETAVFYPGLSVAVSGSGTVQYTVNGVQRTITASNSTVYEPKGTSVTLTASASSFLYAFTGWSGAVTGSSSQTLQLSAPASVVANFGLNFVVMGGIVAVVVVGILGVVLVLRKRGGGGMPYPPPPPP
jgi:hypothetical protein